MTHDVFISYSSQDTAVAGKACKCLEKNGIRCWRAPRDITPGMEYGKAIIEGINNARVMLLVFSAHANRSQQVSREVERAVSKHKLIITFRIENIPPSSSVEFFVSSAHWLDALPKPARKHYKALVKTVAGLLGRSELSVDEETDDSDQADDEFAQALAHTEGLLRAGQWGPCMSACGTLFENAMRQLGRELIDSWADAEVRERIASAAGTAGPDNGDFPDMTLPQLVRVYAESSLFDEIRKQLTSNLQKIREIDWDQVVQWYEGSQAGDSAESCNENDARQMAFWAKVLLYDCELLSGDKAAGPIVPRASQKPDECPFCHGSLETEWSFCPFCGVALDVECEACHRPLAPDFRICPYCETPVTRPGVRGMDHDRAAEEAYRILCEGAYLDNVVNARERAILNEKRLTLGLSTAEAEKIERQCAPENTVEYTRLVEGVLVDHTISEAERVFLDDKAGQLNIDPWLAEQIEKSVQAVNEGNVD